MASVQVHAWKRARGAGVALALVGASLTVMAMQPSMQPSMKVATASAIPGTTRTHPAIWITPPSGQSAAGTKADLTSQNWSGYVDFGFSFTQISGAWTVPSVASTPSPAYSTAWIGIDGAQNSNLIQTGTEEDVDSSGVAHYYPWWEILPAPETPIAQPISPGDHMAANIHQTSPGLFSLTLTDSTKGWTFASNFAYSGLLTSAEWIMERPLICTINGCGVLPTLANFTSIPFSAMTETGSSSSGLQAADMINDAGQITAFPGAIASNAFTDYYGTKTLPPTTTTRAPTTTTVAPTTTTRAPTTTTVAPTTTAPPPPPPPPTPPARSGYWMLGAGGTVFSFGQADNFGGTSVPLPFMPAVHLESTPTGNGYWILDASGAVHSFGDAPFLGSGTAALPGETYTTMSTTPTGQGYWLFTTKGRVLTFGDAGNYGDMSGVVLNGPVIDSVATPSGHGYYMVASDGGVFTFGDAVFQGSMGAVRLNGPVVGLAPDAASGGYWLVATDGGIFSFGGAAFHGSTGNLRLNRPVIGMVAYHDGYLMVASDGGIFDFSSSPFLGSLGANPPAIPIVGVAPLNR